MKFCVYMAKNRTLTLKQMVDQSNRGGQQILIIELAGLSPNLSFHWVARGANVAVHTLAKRFFENVGYFVYGNCPPCFCAMFSGKRLFGSLLCKSPAF